MSKRMAPADRKASILEAATRAAQQHGYSNFRLAHVADLAGCSNALVVSHFATMVQLRRAVMRDAVKHERLDIIATGLAMKDPNCRKITPELRARAIKTIA